MKRPIVMLGVLLLLILSVAILVQDTTVTVGHRSPTSTAATREAATQNMASSPTVTSTRMRTTRSGNREQSSATQTGTPEVPPIERGGIEPFPDAPPCEDHDPVTWHGLWDPERGCHYDHTHNADPTQVDDHFGPVGASYGGQTISYPWQTLHENEMKHEGYKWDVRTVDECTTNFADHNCIMKYRLLFHVVGLFGANFRNHSFAIEAEVCDRSLEDCGIVRTGGWADFGVLCVPYKGQHVPLAEMDPENPRTTAAGVVDCELPPYRGHVPYEEAQQRGRRIQYTWNSSSRYDFNQLVEYDFQSRDDFGGVNAEDPSELNFICPDFTCDSNHSTMLVYEIILKVPAALDTDDDGFVTFSGYNDRYGNVVDDCRPLGPDCIPLEIENVPVGQASFRIRLHPSTPHSDFDVYFCGDATCSPNDRGARPSGWIMYPN